MTTSLLNNALEGSDRSTPTDVGEWCCTSKSPSTFIQHQQLSNAVEVARFEYIQLFNATTPFFSVGCYKACPSSVQVSLTKGSDNLRFQMFRVFFYVIWLHINCSYDERSDQSCCRSIFVYIYIYVCLE